MQSRVTLIFTQIKVGDGVLAHGNTLETLTDLIAPKLSVPIQNVAAIGDGTCRIRGVLSNNGLASGFFVKSEYHANDPDAGEILYAVANAGSEVIIYLLVAGQWQLSMF